MSYICDESDEGKPRKLHIAFSGYCVLPGRERVYKTWWRHQMETFSLLLVLCAGKHRSKASGESVDVFFDLRLYKRFSKQSRRRWFETPSRSLWRQCNEQHSYGDQIKRTETFCRFFYKSDVIIYHITHNCSPYDTIISPTEYLCLTKKRCSMRVTCLDFTSQTMASPIID